MNTSALESTCLMTEEPGEVVLVESIEPEDQLRSALMRLEKLTQGVGNLCALLVEKLEQDKAAGP